MNSIVTRLPTITREYVTAENPDFFSQEMMDYMKTNHEQWEIDEVNGYTCVVVNREESQAKACYLIDPVTLKLSFYCHLGNKVTKL